jgi:hypothetical protein
MSSAPRRIAEYCATVLTSEELGDLGRQSAIGALGEFGGEAPAQLVAEVAAVDRAAGELVGNLELLGLCPGGAGDPGSGERQGCRGGEEPPARRRHKRFLQWLQTLVGWGG